MIKNAKPNGVPSRVKVIKPLRICGFLLEVGDEFEVDEWNETDFGTFFRPIDVEHMCEGMGWLFTTKTFEVIEYQNWNDDPCQEQFYSDMGYGDEQYD